MLGERIPLRECHEITLNASIANLLPLPGSVLVRTVRLAKNNPTKHAALTALVAGLCWVGVSLTVGGIALLTVSVSYLAPVFLAVGIVLLITSFSLRRSLTDQAGGFRDLVLVELLLTAVGGMNLYLAFRAVGFDIDALQSLIVVVSSPLASAAGIFPSGIGLAEAIMSGLSTLLDIPAQVGFLAAAIARLTMTIGLFIGRSVVAFASSSDQPDPVASHLEWR